MCRNFPSRRFTILSSSKISNTLRLLYLHMYCQLFFYIPAPTDIKIPLKTALKYVTPPVNQLSFITHKYISFRPKQCVALRSGQISLSESNFHSIPFDTHSYMSPRNFLIFVFTGLYFNFLDSETGFLVGL